MSTENILFIAGGAFEGLAKQVLDRLHPKRGIGFRNVDSKPVLSGSILNEVIPDDLRGLGFIPEFIGRFPVLTWLDALSEETLIRVLSEPRNALIRQYKALFEQSGARLDFTDEALACVARSAQTRCTGARGLRAILERSLVPTMFELPPDQPTRYLVGVDSAQLIVTAQMLVSSDEKLSKALDERSPHQNDATCSRRHEHATHQQ